MRKAHPDPAINQILREDRMSKPPEMKPIESSAIEAFHYDPASREFRVRFKGGREYVAEGVSLERATAFESNDSPGRYYNKEIAPHHVVRKL